MKISSELVKISSELVRISSELVSTKSELLIINTFTNHTTLVRVTLVSCRNQPNGSWLYFSFIDIFAKSTTHHIGTEYHWLPARLPPRIRSFASFIPTPNTNRVALLSLYFKRCYSQFASTLQTNSFPLHLCLLHNPKFFTTTLLSQHFVLFLKFFLK